MRALVSVRPYRGHLQPVIPLLEALARGGHRVVVATAEELALDVEELGFGWVPAGVHPVRWQAARPEGDPSYGLDPVRSKARDLLTALDDISADLILRDATDLAPALAAEVAGMPVATFSVCRYLPARLWRRHAGPTLAALRREFRLPPDPHLNAILAGPYLDAMPPALQGDEVAELRAHHVVRYETRDARPGSPEWSAPPTPTPAVLVTLGTVFSDRVRIWRVFLRALAGQDMTVIATGTPDSLRETGAALPANVRLVGYVPHSRLLPHCRVVVCHGGFNTVLGAICAGVPLVCVPLAGDQHHNAWVVERLGLGIRLRSSGLTLGAVRDAVCQLLTDPSYATRVDAARRQIAKLPPAESVVPLLERLASAARPDPDPAGP